MLKVLRIFHKDLNDIHHAAFWLGVFAILSGVLGLFRDRMLAGLFGASSVLDIYYSAFRVPDFIYTLMLFFTSVTAIIPMFLKSRDDGEKDVEKFTFSLIMFFSFIVAVISLVAFFLMPKISEFLFPGFSGSEKKISSDLARIMLLSPILLGFSNIFSGILQSVKRFFAYAMSPVFYNLGIIFGILFFLPIFGIKGLAYGIALGAFLNMAIQIPSLFGSGFSVKLVKLDFKKIKNLVVNSMPRTIGLAVNQISILIFTALASTLSAGSIAVFNLSQNLGYLPTTIIGLSYSVAAFPAMASFSLKKEKTNFEEYFSSAFRHIIFWTAPFSALLLVLRAQIVRVILGSGVFSWQDTRLTAASLFLFSLAIVFQSLFLLLVRAFYAEGEVKRPLFINIISAIFSVFSVFIFLKAFLPGTWFSLYLSSVLDISDIADIRVLSLPFGILLGSIFNLIFLLIAFKKTFGWFPLKNAKKLTMEIFFSSFLGGVAAHYSLRLFSGIFDLHTFSGVFSQGFLSGILGIAVIILTLYILRSQEFFEVVSSFKNSIFKTRVPAPEPEKLP